MSTCSVCPLLPPKIKCPYCEFKTRSKGVLVMHLYNDHRDELKEDIRVYGLENKMVRISGNRYRCLICNKVVVVDDELIHLAYHLIDKIEELKKERRVEK